ncbi:MAG: hypothetical protein J6I47_06590 [Ruminococcus sp.]|nr:hypothetical protein [Ruminococcus sp.]
MEIIAMKCPSCNANIDYKGDSKILKCKYCGSNLYYDDGTKTLIIKDVAKIAKNNFEKEVNDYSREKEIALKHDETKDKNKTQSWIVAVIIVHLIVPITALLSKLFKIDSTLCLLIFFLIVLFAPLILAAIKPKNASKHGKGFFIILFYITLIAAIVAFIYLRKLLLM